MLDMHTSGLNKEFKKVPCAKINIRLARNLFPCRYSVKKNEHSSFEIHAQTECCLDENPTKAWGHKHFWQYCSEDSHWVGLDSKPTQ